MVATNEANTSVHCCAGLVIPLRRDPYWVVARVRCRFNLRDSAALTALLHAMPIAGACWAWERLAQPRSLEPPRPGDGWIAPGRPGSARPLQVSTTLEIYPLPIPENQRATVEKLSVLMADDGKSDQKLEGLAVATEQIQ